MDQDTVLGILRHVLTSAGGYLVADGLLTQSQLSDGAGALCVLVGIIWSIWNKYRHRQALVANKSSVVSSQ
jgi:hypothetical protein